MKSFKLNGLSLSVKALYIWMSISVPTLSYGMDWNCRSALKGLDQGSLQVTQLFSQKLLDDTDVLYVNSKDLASEMQNAEFLRLLAGESGAFTIDPRLSSPSLKERDENILQELKSRFGLRKQSKAIVVLFKDKIHNEAFLIHELAHVRQGERGEVFEPTQDIFEYVSSRHEVDAMLTVIVAYKHQKPGASFADFWKFHKEFDISHAIPLQLKQNPSFQAHRFLYEAIVVKDNQVHLTLDRWISDPLGTVDSMDSWITAQNLILSQLPAIRPRMLGFINSNSH